MEKKELRDNRFFAESLMIYFPDKVGQVAKFVTLLHDVITAA